MVQFADDPKLGGEQRLALAPLAPIRGEINGLIDGWRISATPDKSAKAKLFDRRAADAVTVALQGDQPQAMELLKILKADILEERTSVARSQYVIVAAITAVVLVLVFGLATRLPETVRSFVDANLLWLAVGMGAVGAFFSIALGIRSRSILTDLQSRHNAVDAVLRIIIGAISALILSSLLRGKLVTFGFGTVPLTLEPSSPFAIDLAIVVAFAAGFSERLVGDLLGQSVLTAASRLENPVAGGMAGRAEPAPEANEKNPRGRPAVKALPVATIKESMETPDARPEGDDIDCCLAEVHLHDDELTDDVELPATRGGVEKPSAQG
jgi:hypothetical protein